MSLPWEKSHKRDLRDSHVLKESENTAATHMTTGLRPGWAQKTARIPRNCSVIHPNPWRKHATRKIRKEPSSHQLHPVTIFSGQLRWGHSQSSPWYLTLFNTMAQWVFLHKLGFSTPARVPLLKPKLDQVSPLRRTFLWLLVSLRVKAKVPTVACQIPHYPPDVISYSTPLAHSTPGYAQLWPFPLNDESLLLCWLPHLFRLCSDFTFLVSVPWPLS